MNNEELIARLQLPWPKDESVEEVCLPVWVLELTTEAADRVTALVSENRALKRLNEAQAKMLDAEETRANRLDLAVEYILDGMGIHYPDYEIDADDDFLDAANSKWVRDTLTRLAEAMKGNDEAR